VTTTGVGVSATRSWNDRGGLGINNDYVPQCNLLNPLANGECGPLTPSTFGQPGVIVNQFDPDLLTGFGHRQYNWEFTAGIQHEVFPRVSVDVGWFRRIWGNFPVVDNTQITAADFTRFNAVVPSDPRLPGGGGYTVTGLYDLNPSAVGKVTNYNTLSDKIGNQYEHWNGYEVAVNARMRNGLNMQLAFGGAKQIEDNCDVVAVAPEILNVGLPAVWRPAQYCHRETPLLTQVKGYGIYTVPKIAVQVAATLRSTPGVSYDANFVATNAYLASSSTLGRPLSGNAANMQFNLIAANSQFLDRRNELDLRFGKVLKMNRAKAIVSLDIFNTTNTNTPISANSSFAVWQAPTEILNPRLAKISVQFDF